VTSTQFLDEFVILKFDKCSDWPEIARKCVTLLGNTIYQGTGNLNTKTLQTLRGKVIVLFTTDGYNEVQHHYQPGSGILAVRTISEAPYDANIYHGMQYCGKGGTNWKSGGSKQEKLQENYEKQLAKFRSGLDAGGDPDVIGMMYWTTTGFVESISQRNDTMWEAPQGKLPPALKLMFKNGLKSSMESRIATSVDPTNYASGTILKVFMPNIVMIDF